MGNYVIGNLGVQQDTGAKMKEILRTISHNFALQEHYRWSGEYKNIPKNIMVPAMVIVDAEV